MNKLLEWYTEETKQQNLIYDIAQINAIKKFDEFLANFNKQCLWHKLINQFRQPQKLGFYISGAVGQGKSMLMNTLYDAIPTNKKLRIHFHQFMNNIHQELAKLKSGNDSLKKIAKTIQKQYKIIFLDEIHVSDIANAMILQGLFENIFKCNIYIITSSNYPPSNLYKDGLMRDRFLPAITLLENKLENIAIDSKHDYRTTNTSHNQLFIIRINNATAKLNDIFDSISQGNSFETNGNIEIQHRKISFIKKSKNIIWFDFNVVCGNLRSQLDYLELAEYYSWFVIENIVPLTPQNKDIARRFTWLIDILYDDNKKIALSSSCDITNIYPHGDFANEFTRTISRLTEMQTNKYLAKIPKNHLVIT